MTLPTADTPLYNHPLPDIEQWLVSQGCQQSSENRHCWHVARDGWQAELALDTDCLTIRYSGAKNSGEEVQRSFKYSLSRQDLEEAVFAGP
ncbi:MAG: DUF3143 domain-containing protein [Elainellaceae cyanobacterium]